MVGEKKAKYRMQELIEYFEKKFNKKTSEFHVNEWDQISYSQNPYLSEDFIREFKDKVNWDLISYYQKLSEEFIREFKDRLHLYDIVAHQKLSGEFIEEFIDIIFISRLSKHNKINYLKYKLKNGKISNEQYLKELLNVQARIN